MCIRHQHHSGTTEKRNRSIQWADPVLLPHKHLHRRPCPGRLEALTAAPAKQARLLEDMSPSTPQEVIGMKEEESVYGTRTGQTGGRNTCRAVRDLPKGAQQDTYRRARPRFVDCTYTCACKHPCCHIGVDRDGQTRKAWRRARALANSLQYRRGEKRRESQAQSRKEVIVRRTQSSEDTHVKSFPLPFIGAW